MIIIKLSFVFENKLGAKSVWNYECILSISKINEEFQILKSLNLGNMLSLVLSIFSVLIYMFIETLSN